MKAKIKPLLEVTLLGTQKGLEAVQEFIQETGVATRRWLSGEEEEVEDTWGWGRLNEGRRE